MRHILLFFIAFLLYNHVLGQSIALQKANKHFSRFEYKDAANLYESVLEKNSNNNIIIHNIAQCYWKLNDMPKAEKWLEKVVKNAEATPEDYLQYAETLEENNKYDEAKIWFDKYNKVKGSDKRGKLFSESLSHLNDYYLDSSRYKVSLTKRLSSSAADFSPTYYQNGILYVSERNHEKYSTSSFQWDQSHYLDLYFAEFDNKELNSFKKEQPFNSKMNTKYHEGPSAISKDQTFMVFTRNNFFHNKAHTSKDGVNKLKLFYDEFKDGKWQSAKNFEYNNDNYSCGHPALTANGKTMYFVSDMPGSIGGTDLWQSHFNNGTWSKPENLGDKINSEGNEMFPTLVNDSVFYFASNGLGGLGGLDIFYAPFNSGKFGEVKNFGYPINSSHDDFGLIYDPNNTSGYFSSNRINKEGGSDDIYYFKQQGYLISVNVIDEITLKPLGLSDLNYAYNGKTNSVKTDENGNFKFRAISETDYNFATTFPGYINTLASADTKGKNSKRNIELTIPMKKLAYRLIATVTDGKTKAFVNEAEIKFFDNLNNKYIFIDNKTNQLGSVTKMLSNKTKGDQIKFEITLKKEGYLSKTEIFDFILTDDSIVQIPLNLLEIDRISIGTDVGKLIDIMPIYFDLDKYDIRADAAMELDKMVKVMEENPNLIIELGSHTDCRASASYNLNLSDRRAKSSANYIISKGINKKRIYGKGYGESKLINKCACEFANESKCSEEEHQLNRRTEFKIVKM